MSTAEIEKAIPHRPPMRLLDEIVSRDDASIVCKKTFSASEFFVQGHFPGQPIVPGVIQCECCLQAGAVLLQQQMEADSGSLPVATRMDAVKFKRMVRPGDTVEIHVTLNEQVSNAFYLTGKMLLDGKLAMRLDFACSVTPAQPSETEPSKPETTS
ncbi:beta-hydroxyacyl-ACP dehydratase [Stieleria sp. TO1_6]|uniref:3-hydroxyacyl-ACP dehydratase FabZ family protein n=1 Tax=Stieleria tagensis TaxID=2956795 RepID=UPI00209A94A1|nr:3-hydroxyacyl-ACP dehydratase FabZ family protein [Stieleria tagensis]MCO8125521.1 beta-hydroxyacyl-ACP dehydratase [Stieleria tagensis]